MPKISLKQSQSLPQSSMSPREQRNLENKVSELKNSLVRAEKDHQESVRKLNQQIKEKEEMIKKKAEEIKGLRKD